MYRYAFPKCFIQGSTDPVPYGHLVLHGAVPQKCRDCKYLFEGSCRRAADTVEDYQSLDHGPCPKHGEANPIELRGKNPERPLFVPKKCASCEFLSNDPIRGYVCLYQKEIWGGFPRSLDWASWEPELAPIGIQQKVIATVEVLSNVKLGLSAKAVLELKRLYPGLSTEAAIKCCAIFAKRIG